MNGMVGFAWQTGQTASSPEEPADFSFEKGRRNFLMEDELRRGRSNSNISCTILPIRISKSNKIDNLEVSTSSYFTIILHQAKVVKYASNCKLVWERSHDASLFFRKQVKYLNSQRKNIITHCVNSNQRALMLTLYSISTYSSSKWFLIQGPVL